MCNRLLVQSYNMHFRTLLDLTKRCQMTYDICMNILIIHLVEHCAYFNEILRFIL